MGGEGGRTPGGKGGSCSLRVVKGQQLKGWELNRATWHCPVDGQQNWLREGQLPPSSMQRVGLTVGSGRMLRLTILRSCRFWDGMTGPQTTEPLCPWNWMLRSEDLHGIATGISALYRLAWQQGSLLRQGTMSMAKQYLFPRGVWEVLIRETRYGDL